MDESRPQEESENIPVLPDDVPVTMPELPLRRIIRTAQQFKAISDPVRTRILGIIQYQPATAKQIADRLKATPGAIGHHLHVLEEAGFVQVVARRVTRGIIASYYTRTARIFIYDLPREVTGLSVGLDIITDARNEMAEAIASVEEDPDRRDGFPHVRLSPERARYYRDRIEALMDDLVSEPADPNGKIYGVYISMFTSPIYRQVSNADASPVSNAEDSHANDNDR